MRHTSRSVRARRRGLSRTVCIAIRAAAGPRDPAAPRRSAITKRPLSHGSICSVDLFEFINDSYVTTKVSDSAIKGCGRAAVHGGQVAEQLGSHSRERPRAELPSTRPPAAARSIQRAKPRAISTPMRCRQCPPKSSQTSASDPLRLGGNAPPPSPSLSGNPPTRPHRSRLNRPCADHIDDVQP